MKKKIGIVIIAAFMMFSVSACKAGSHFEERDKFVEFGKYENGNVGYDIADPNFDYTNSINRVEPKKGFSQGSPITGDDNGEGTNTLKNLKDGEADTFYKSALNTEGNHVVSFTVDFQKAGYIDRIELAPVVQGGKSVCFPKAFYIEISLNNSDWTVVVSKNGYPEADTVKSFRIGAQSARYLRFTATELRQDEGGAYRLALADIGAWFDDYYNLGSEDAQAGATYYVSSTEGNDSNDGLSPEHPLRTFYMLNRFRFGPGNRILLKKGDTWLGQTMMPVGDGTAEAPIVISSYGEGATPVIKAGLGAAWCIRIYNNNHYVIENIDFANSVAGIKVEGDLRNYNAEDNSFDTAEGYTIRNCNFADIHGNYVTSSEFLMPYPDMYYGSGIQFTSTGAAATWGERVNGKVNGMPYAQDDDSPSTYMKNIEVSDCNFLRCDTGVFNALVDLGNISAGKDVQASYYNQGCTPNGGHLDAFSVRSVCNVTMKNLQCVQNLRSGGIMIYGVHNGLFENILTDETGILGMHWGVAGFQISLSSDCVVQNCEFSRTYLRNGSPDGEGMDFESGNVNITLKDSYVHDNEGPAILFYGGNQGWGGINYNNVVENCVLENNGTFNGNGSVYYDHSKVFKDYPELSKSEEGDGNTYVTGNAGGHIRNTTVVLKYEGQGYQTGYVVDGRSPKGIYDEKTDKTYVGMEFDLATNVVKNPNGTVIAGEGVDLTASGVVSAGLRFKLGSTDANSKFTEDHSLALGDGNATGYGSGTFSLAQLYDNELSGVEHYNTGFCSKEFDTADMDGGNITFEVDFGAPTDVRGLRMFGVQTQPSWGVGQCGSLLPRGFTVYASDDGVNWRLVKIMAKAASGGLVQVDSVRNFTSSATRAANDFEFADAALMGSLQTRYIRIVVDELNYNSVTGKYMMQIAEIQVINGYDFDFASEYVAD